MSVTQPPDDMRALLRAAAAPPGAAGPECVDEETIAAMAEGRLETAARNAVARHLAACARCRIAVVSVVRGIAEPAVAREIAAIERRPRRRITRFIVPIAAAAALVIFFVQPRRSRDVDAEHRAPTFTSAIAPVPLAPVAAMAHVHALRWSAVPGADRYRVTLFDVRGRSLYEAQLADTVAVLPDSIVLTPRQSYLWTVEARIGWDRWSSSPLTKFSVEPAPRR